MRNAVHQWLQIIFCSCVKETVFFSFLRSLLRENGRSLRFPTIFIKKQTNKLGDRMIKQLLKSVIAKYRDLSVSCRWQIIDLLATDKSQYFAIPRPIIVNYGCIMRIIKSRFLWWERYKLTCVVIQ